MTIEPGRAAWRERVRETAEQREWVALQKGYLICGHLRDGEAMRTCDVVDLMGVVKWDTAYRAMELLAAADPALKQNGDGFWYLDFEQMSV